MTPLASAFNRITAELNQAGFLRVEFQSELVKPVSEFSETEFRIGLALEPDDEVSATFRQREEKNGVQG